MKKQRLSKRNTIGVITSVICSAVMAFTVSAETANGIKLSISTDKTKYSVNEDVVVSISAENNNSYSIENVSVDTFLPNGFVTAGNHSTNISYTTLEGGGNIKDSFIISKHSDVPVDPTPVPTPDPTPDNPNPDSPKPEPDNPTPEPTPTPAPVNPDPDVYPTNKPNYPVFVPPVNADYEDIAAAAGVEAYGENIEFTHINIGKFVIAFLLTLAAIGGVAMLIKRRKDIKKILSLFLAIGIVMPICGELSTIDVSAESGVVVSSNSFVYGGEEYTISVELKYSYINKIGSLSDFSVNEIYLAAGQDNNVLFTVKSDIQLRDIYVISEDNSKIGIMHDDGLDGDSCASDGVYSLATTITKNSSGKDLLYASSDNIVSNSLTLYYFEQPTEDDRNKAMEIHRNLVSFDDQYIDEEGYLPFEYMATVMSRVAEYAKSLCDSGEAIFFEVSDKCVSVKLSCGVSLSYSPKLKGVYLGTDEVSVAVYQPYYDWVSTLTATYIQLPSDVNREVDLIDSAANNIADKFDNCTFNTRQRDKNVSLESVKKFGMNQIILWQGHGVWMDSQKHSVILTGSDFNWDAWLWNPIYWWDCVQDRIVETSGSEAFSYKYIEKYCGNLTNSVIYLGPCQGGYDDVLANSFLRKGAVGVIANSDSILCLYGDMMEYTTISLLSKINPNTGDYYTLGESLSKAKEMYGRNDSRYRSSNDPGAAEPLLFGGSSAENYRLGNYDGNDTTTMISMTIVDNETKEHIPNVSVTIFNKTENLAPKTFITNLEGTINIDIENDYAIPVSGSATFEILLEKDGYYPLTMECVVNVGEWYVYLDNIELRPCEESTVKGTLSGKICRATDRISPVSNAQILIFKNNKLYKTENNNEQGNYSVELPVGEYYISISAQGYIPFNSYAEVTANENTYMETFLLIEGTEGETGTASGVITDAYTGQGLEGVTLAIRKDWNNSSHGDVITEIMTDASGKYTVDLPLGNYSMYAVKDGYVSTVINIIVQPGITENQNGAITPFIMGNNYRVVLTWGENPKDLDSHIVGKLSNGNEFHVYYKHKSQYDGDTKICDLDVDDTTSYGPETITLNTNSAEPYYYYIYHYAGSGSLATSEAQIKLYQGERHVATFNVPVDQGNDRYWNVFSIENGQLVVRNTITSSPYKGVNTKNVEYAEYEESSSLTMANFAAFEEGTEPKDYD